MRIALTLSLVLAAAPAWAEWVKVGRTDEAVHYVDPATLRKDGDLRRVWVMQDLRDASSDGVLSIRALQEYDCADGRFRYLSVASHAAPMAGGQVLASHEVRDDWSAAGMQRSIIGKMACGK